MRANAQLRVEWRFAASRDSHVIDDCYGLNPDGDTTWAYYYADFTLARIHSDHVDTFRTGLEGGSALMTDGSLVGIVGGYRKHRDRFVLAEIADPVTPLRTTKLVLPLGQQLPPGSVMCGQGADLHVFVGREWFRADLGDVQP